MSRALQRDVPSAKNIQGLTGALKYSLRNKKAWMVDNTVEVERLVKPPATPDECK